MFNRVLIFNRDLVILYYSGYNPIHCGTYDELTTQ